MNIGADERAAAGSAMDRWFVVQLKPNCAALAERNLARQGFWVFAPFEEASVRAGRQFKLVQRPLFPGYIFVSFDPLSSPWRSINGTYGVARLISLTTNRPTPVPAKLIEGLKASCDRAGKYVSAYLPGEGERVRIAAGPFADFIATVDKIEPQRRVWVLLDILGSSTRVAVNAEDLRLVS
jgi:transcriptional antiterminator RfaH